VTASCGIFPLAGLRCWCQYFDESDYAFGASFRRYVMVQAGSVQSSVQIMNVRDTSDLLKSFRKLGYRVASTGLVVRCICTDLVDR